MDVYFKKHWLVFLAGLFLVVLILFGIREYQTRSQNTYEGVISPCRYADAGRECSFFTTFSQERFLLTDGSVEKLKSLTSNNFYGRRVKLTGSISRQQINVKDIGLLLRFQVKKVEFFN